MRPGGTSGNGPLPAIRVSWGDSTPFASSRIAGAGPPRHHPGPAEAHRLAAVYLFGSRILTSCRPVNLVNSSTLCATMHAALWAQIRPGAGGNHRFLSLRWRAPGRRRISAPTHKRTRDGCRLRPHQRGRRGCPPGGSCSSCGHARLTAADVYRFAAAWSTVARFHPHARTTVWQAQHERPSMATSGAQWHTARWRRRRWLSAVQWCTVTQPTALSTLTRVSHRQHPPTTGWPGSGWVALCLAPRGEGWTIERSRGYVPYCSCQA